MLQLVDGECHNLWVGCVTTCVWGVWKGNLTTCGWGVLQLVGGVRYNLWMRSVRMPYVHHLSGSWVKSLVDDEVWAYKKTPVFMLAEVVDSSFHACWSCWLRIHTFPRHPTSLLGYVRHKVWRSVVAGGALKWKQAAETVGSVILIEPWTARPLLHQPLVAHVQGDGGLVKDALLTAELVGVHQLAFDNPCAWLGQLGRLE